TRCSKATTSKFCGAASSTHRLLLFPLSTILPMTVTVRSFAKINLGLCIGAKRSDNFHELRTVYQTIGLHDVIHVRVGRGSGIEIRCEDPRVPTDETNTCYRVLESAMATLRAKGKVSI